MNQDFADALRTRRDEVGITVDNLREQLAKLNDEIALREAQLRNLEELLRLETGVTSAAKADSTSASVKPIDSAEALLKDVGRPMHYQEIAKRLQADGVYIPGKNPAANLLTQMTRDARFRKRGRGVYAVSRRGVTRP